MKVLVALLACSLLANAFFVVAISRKPASEKLAASHEHANAERNPVAAAQDPAEALFVVGATGLASLKNELEAAGFPADTVKAIIIKLAHEPHQTRLRAVLAREGLPPFWTTGRPVPELSLGSPEEARTLAAMTQAANDQVRALYGDPFYDDPQFFESARRQLGNLPDDKLVAIARIQSDYADLRRKATAGTPYREQTDEQRRQLVLLDRAEEDDLAAALTPDELFEYRVRQSPRARALRDSIARFNPTEEEFRAIYSTQEELIAKTGSTAPEDVQAGAFASERGRAGLAALLEGKLPAERIADLTFATSSQEANLVRLTNRLGLPISAARELRELQDTTSQAVQHLRADPTLAEPERAARLSALAAEARTKATGVLGSRGIEPYLATSGSWVNQLTAATPVPARQ